MTVHRPILCSRISILFTTASHLVSYSLPIYYYIPSHLGQQLIRLPCQQLVHLPWQQLVHLTTTQNLLRSVSKIASEAGGPVARLGYSRQGSRVSDRLG